MIHSSSSPTAARACGEVSTFSRGAGQGLLGWGTGFAKAVLACGTALPEPFHRAGVAQRVAAELQLRLRSVTPELLRPFHPPVELLDLRLPKGRGDRQPLTAIFVVPHPPGIVAQVGEAIRKGRPPLRIGLPMHQTLQLRQNLYLCDMTASLLRSVPYFPSSPRRMVVNHPPSGKHAQIPPQTLSCTQAGQGGESLWHVPGRTTTLNRLGWTSSG